MGQMTENLYKKHFAVNLHPHIAANSVVLEFTMVIIKGEFYYD